MASLLLLLICNRYLQINSSIFSFSLVFNNKLDLTLLLVALLSAAGVPPFLGFWTKTAILIVIGKSAPVVLLVAC